MTFRDFSELNAVSLIDSGFVAKVTGQSVVIRDENDQTHTYGDLPNIREIHLYSRGSLDQENLNSVVD